ncbi:MAG: hypothetical protein AAF517_00010 [Planctomycetota bacterium]
MKTSPTLILVTGLWIGATLAVLGAVAYNFIGINRAVEANERLAERVDFTPNDRAARRQSPIYVFAGELNRSLLYAFNRVQLGLAGLAFLLCAARLRSVALSGALLLALGGVVWMAFWLAPEITEIGRSIDFKPKPEAGQDEAFDRFDFLHRIYVSIEGIKTAVVACVAAVATWGFRKKTEADG